MAEQIAPTRSNLLQRRDQLRLAIRGADLLKRKRDALIGEFFDLVKVSLAARRELGDTSKEAYFSLFLAKAWDGPEAVESLSLAQQGNLEVDIKIQNLFGVKVPEVQAPEFSNELPFSPINAGAKTLDAAAEFKRLTAALVQVAATETRLRRIGEEIKKTSRRVNALEQLVIPGINGQIKDIRSVLDQRALEEVTVLKRIKAKLEARAAEEAETQNIAAPYPGNDTTMGETVKRIEDVATALAPEQSDANKKEAVGTAATSASSSAKEAGGSSSSDAAKASGSASASSPKEVSTTDTTSKSDAQADLSADTKADAKADVPSSRAPLGEAAAGEVSSNADSSKAETSTSTKSGGALLGSDVSIYLADVANYTDNVKEDVVKAILAYFGDNVNNRDAMTVACSQQKELSYIKKNFLKGKLNLKESNKVLDKAMNDICAKMGKSNRNKSSLTFYYLLTERFDKFSVWQ